VTMEGEGVDVNDGGCFRSSPYTTTDKAYALRADVAAESNHYVVLPSGARLSAILGHDGHLTYVPCKTWCFRSLHTNRM